MAYLENRKRDIPTVRSRGYNKIARYKTVKTPGLENDALSS
jgi:hypothetical protein